MAKDFTFDIDAARKEGYSDAEIADELAKQEGYADNLAKERNLDIEGARKEGHSDASIILDLISNTKKEKPAEEELTPKNWALAGAGIAALPKLGSFSPTNMMAEAIRRSRSGNSGAVQNWATQMIGNKNVSIPLSELERLSGMPARDYKEVNLAWEKIKQTGIDLSAYEKKYGSKATEKLMTNPVIRAIMNNRAVQNVVGTVAPVVKFAAPVATAAGTGYDLAEAINRFKKDDYLGGTMAGIGALGGLATMAPHPAAKIIGGGLSMGMPYALDYLDKVRKGDIKHEAPTEQPAQYAMGGHVYHFNEGSNEGLQERATRDLPAGSFSFQPQFVGADRNFIGGAGRVSYDQPLGDSSKLQLYADIMANKMANENPRMRIPSFGVNFTKQFKEGGHTTPAWQRAEGKNPEGGLNAKGRASYHAETGGTLKRPQPEGGARKDSFCARMEGMKKKLTSAETANDPDSRINKSLRKWKC